MHDLYYIIHTCRKKRHIEIPCVCVFMLSFSLHYLCDFRSIFLNAVAAHQKCALLVTSVTPCFHYPTAGLAGVSATHPLASV